jgi:hypothetical protein
MANFGFINRHNQSLNFAVASYDTRDSILKVIRIRDLWVLSLVSILTNAHGLDLHDHLYNLIYSK